MSVSGMRRRTVVWQHIVPTGNRRHALVFRLPAAGVIATNTTVARENLRTPAARLAA